MSIENDFSLFAPAAMSCITKPEVSEPVSPEPVMLEKSGPSVPGVLCHSVIEELKTLAVVVANVETVVNV